VVPETDSIKQFFMEVPLTYGNSKESSFMEKNSATQGLSLVESQFCYHVNNSAVAPKVRLSGTCYVTFLECCRKFLQSHSAMHISFPNSSNIKVFSMFNRIITNEF